MLVWQKDATVARRGNSGVARRRNSGVVRRRNNGVARRGNSGVARRGNSGVARRRNSGVARTRNIRMFTLIWSDFVIAVLVLWWSTDFKQDNSWDIDMRRTIGSPETGIAYLAITMVPDVHTSGVKQNILINDLITHVDHLS